ncbi:MAG: hypothetical protein LAP85_05325 [Acidobacteriia bacterium]|nr:hypothetical protein [Terriglobia bacterium]
MTFLAGTILTVLMAIYVLMPLFKEPKGNLEVELLAETELDRLLNRKAVVYSNIKDLEFEYKMGRLGDADFHRLEAGFKAEAAEILQKLDHLGVEENLDEGLEQAIAARKAKLTSGRGQEPRACPACGSEVAPGKQFCADCGRRL